MKININSGLFGTNSSGNLFGRIRKHTAVRHRRKRYSDAILPTPPRQNMPNMVNPASSWAAYNKLPIKIVNGPLGQAGMVTLPNGQVVDEWTYFRTNPPPAGWNPITRTIRPLGKPWKVPLPVKNPSHYKR